MTVADAFARSITGRTFHTTVLEVLCAVSLWAHRLLMVSATTRFTTELGEMDALVRSCKKKGESEHHYNRKVCCAAQP